MRSRRCSQYDTCFCVIPHAQKILGVWCNDNDPYPDLPWKYPVTFSLSEARNVERGTPSTHCYSSVVLNRLGRRGTLRTHVLRAGFSGVFGTVMVHWHLPVFPQGKNYSQILELYDGLRDKYRLQPAVTLCMLDIMTP